MFSETEQSNLERYLQNSVNGFSGPMSLDKFAGGQSNPTYKVTAQSGVYVLRCQPLGKLLKSAHAVDREYRVISALAGTAVPVASVYHLCENTQIIGSMFYLMAFVDGDIYWSPSLKKVANNESRHQMYLNVVDTLAALHSVDIESVQLSDYGKAGSYYQRQLTRWVAQYEASEIEPIDAMNQLMEWLKTHLPEDDGRVSLVHGDYRLDNIMFEKGDTKVAAVLDWELSTLGHPTADLAYFCMCLRMPAEAGPLVGLRGIDREAIGIPSEQAMIEQYCQAMGIREVDNWSFCLAFSFFRLAAIAQGVAKRATQGNASSEQAAQAGAFVKPLAKMALEVIYS